MSSQPSATTQSGSPSSSPVQQAAPSAPQTSEGRTTIADGVVQKIASLAAREVSGVYALGGGAARTLGALRERIPGSSQATGQGVSVEVGERQAAIDLDLVTEYGVSIAELARAVRRNVVSSVEGMTGLEVTEVNISVNDIHLPTDEDQSPTRSRRGSSEPGAPAAAAHRGGPARGVRCWPARRSCRCIPVDRSYVATFLPGRRVGRCPRRRHGR